MTQPTEPTQLTYIEQQILRTCPLPLYPTNQNGQLRLKIHSERGETNWLNITPQQLTDIETILNNTSK